MVKNIIFCSALVMFSGTAIAQDSLSTTPVKEITLQQAIHIALDNNYNIKKAKNNLELSDMNRKSAMADFLPSVSANFGGTERGGQQFSQVTVSYRNQVTKSIDGGLSANLTLFSGLEHIYNLRQSSQSKLSQQEQLRQQKEDVIFNAASAYLTILLDQQLLGIDKENLKSSQSQLNQIKAEVQVGARPIADQYNQEATVAQDNLTVIQDQNKLDADKMALIRQLQIDPLKEYKFVTPEIDTAAIHQEIPDLPDMINAALNNRSDIQSQKYAIKASLYNIKIAQSRRYPTLSLNAGINTVYSDQIRDPLDLTRTMPFGTQFFDRNVNKYVGFSVQIPIFNNLNTSYNVESARVNYRNSKLDLENLRLNVIQEIRQAYNDYKNYAQQLKSTQIALIAAQKAYETQKERYQVGAGTLVELTQANAQYVNAQSTRQQALYRFIFQQQLIRYYMGQINADMKINGLQF